MKNKLFLSLILGAGCILVLCLQGCAPAVVVGAAAATTGGIIVTDDRSPKTMLEDRETTFQAQSKIDHDPDLKSKTHIEASTFNQVVLLVGQAPTEQLRQRAVTLIGTLPTERVKLIRNEIVVGEPVDKRTHLNDTWITTKAKSDLLTENTLHSAKIKIITENGVVYMMGLVTKGQGNLAAKVISDIEGVKKVVKLFEYIN